MKRFSDLYSQFELKRSSTPQKCISYVQLIFPKDRVKGSSQWIVTKKGLLDLTFKDTANMVGAILMVARNLRYIQADFNGSKILVERYLFAYTSLTD